MTRISRLLKKYAADAREAVTRIDQQVEQLKKTRNAYVALIIAIEGVETAPALAPINRVSPETRKQISDRGIALQRELRRGRREQGGDHAATD